MARSALAQETVFALRETIARLEGKPIAALAAAQAQEQARDLDQAPGHTLGRDRDPERVSPFGISALDTALDGGLPLDGITEIRSTGFCHAGAASGFVLGLAARMQSDTADARLPVLWIADRMAHREAGLAYPVGLKAFGIDIGRFYHALPSRLDDALWLAEAALASGIFSATLLEIRGNPKAFGLTESRRLSLRAKAAGRPLLLLRHAGEEEASSALFRFLAEPALSSERRLPDGSMLGGSIGSSVLRLTLEKSRNPAPLSLHLEWNSHDRQFFIPDHPEQAQPARQPAAYPGAVLSPPGNGQDPAPPLGALLAFDRAS